MPRAIFSEKEMPDAVSCVKMADILYVSHVLYVSHPKKILDKRLNHFQKLVSSD